MRKFKYILIFLILVISTLVIEGGTKAKPCLLQSKPTILINKTVVQGFPDMISFANYINQ